MEKSCPFCSPSQFGERFIGEIGSFNVVPTLGQITEGGYVLLVSKEHIPCWGGACDERNLDRVVASLSAMLSKEYGGSPITIFEHGIVGQTVFHAHLHLIPETIAIGARVRNDFPNRIEQFEDFADFQLTYTFTERPYLLWREPGNKLSVCWNPPAPPQYLRTVVAEALGKPERANWRIMDAALDRKLYLETVARLKPYFPQVS